MDHDAHVPIRAAQAADSLMTSSGDKVIYQVRLGIISFVRHAIGLVDYRLSERCRSVISASFNRVL
jgi:hypothetical protein